MSIKRESTVLESNGSGKRQQKQSSILSHFQKIKSTVPKEDPIPLNELPRESSEAASSTSLKSDAIVDSESSDLCEEIISFTPEEEQLFSLEIAHIPESWMNVLVTELRKPYFTKLKKFIEEERRKNLQIFPPTDCIYTWAKLCPFDTVKVVILGQDPYHNDQQAMGLCFSVPPSITPPPSLVNIYKELSKDIDGFVTPKHGNLSYWAQQGVLLLNTSLTVRAHEPASHSGKGWELFTDAVIAAVNERREGIVFILWGNHAQKKAAMVDRKRHLVLTSAHPSPLSASRGFFGCKHFSKTNQFLIQNGVEPIDWNLGN